MTQYEQIIKILAKAVALYINQESISICEKGLDKVSKASIHWKTAKGVEQ